MIYNFISSKQNAIIKRTNSLYSKKFRDKENAFIVEGLRGVTLICENALNDVEYILLREDYVDKFNYDVDYNKIYLCSNEVFKGMADAKNAQGILAVCKKTHYEFSEIFNKDNLFIFVCENIQDPGNAGTLIRTVDSIGADAIVFTKGSVDLYNPKVVRSTVGSILNVKVFENLQINEVVENLKANNVYSYGTSLEAKNNHFEEVYKNKLAVFLGNEANGLLSETLKMVDFKVKIPMEGSAESLNVGVAGSVIGYEILRQRNYNI